MTTLNELRPYRSRGRDSNAKRSEDLTTDDVRQGTTGHNVRYVLLASLVGAFVALGVTWAWIHHV